jgi:choline dehydrogenase-like flavoprotein
VRGSKTAVSGFQFDINLMRPEGRGTLRLASADPRAQPLIDPQFLTGEREKRDLLRGIERVREIATLQPLAAVTGAELSPGVDVASEVELSEAIRRLANTAHHPVGTCRMGIDSDTTAVVDGELRVRGIDALRVCDASVFPDQITGNPTAAIVAIAEKAADLIRGRQVLPPTVV